MNKINFIGEGSIQDDFEDSNGYITNETEFHLENETITSNKWYYDSVNDYIRIEKDENVIYTTPEKITYIKIKQI